MNFENNDLWTLVIYSVAEDFLSPNNQILNPTLKQKKQTILPLI